MKAEKLFFDSELDYWNMSFEALEEAFVINTDVKLIVLGHLYETPSKCDLIRKTADKHGALIVDDAA